MSNYPGQASAPDEMTTATLIPTDQVNQTPVYIHQQNLQSVQQQQPYTPFPNHAMHPQAAYIQPPPAPTYAQPPTGYAYPTQQPGQYGTAQPINEYGSPPIVYQTNGPPGPNVHVTTPYNVTRITQTDQQW